MSDYPFNIPAGLDIGQFLVFAPHAAIVSNYSPYYIYFPDGLNFCPPWTVGAVIPLAHATYARATWKNSPFGNQVILALPSGVVYTALITFTDSNVAASGGTSIANPFLTPKSAVGGVYNTLATSYQAVTLPTGSVVDSGGELSVHCHTASGVGFASLYITDSINPFAFLASLLVVNPTPLVVPSCVRS